MKERKGISGSTLKIIAIITMLIDHIGAGVLGRLLVVRGMNEAGRSECMVECQQYPGNYISDDAVLDRKTGFPFSVFFYRRI